MPTYLTRENSPIYSPNSDILDLDPNNTLDFSGHKHPINGLAHTLPLRPSRSNNLHDSFDESSTSSTHASDVSDSIPTQMNGTRPTSMSSLPNGSAGAGGGGDFDYHDLDHEQDAHHHHHNNNNNHNDYRSYKHPFQNGASVTMPDRTAPPPPITIVKKPTSDTEQSSPTDNYLTPPTINSPAGGSIDHAIKTNGTGSPNYAPPAIPSQSNAANGHATPAPAASTTSLSPDPNAHKQPSSPHRFSSPPLYNSAGATPNASTSTGLQPPNGGLKHRHTLEVPGTQSNRASKDGSDTAFSSGRFSPTSTTQRVRRASLNLVRRDTRSMQSDAPRDEVVPDEDALRWAEHYRQKRASKRKRREEEDDDRVLVGTKVDEHHANWVTAYNMLTGIRVSVSRTNAKLDRPLTDADFEAKQKSTFDMYVKSRVARLLVKLTNFPSAGNELVPSAKYDFKFKDYAPWVFRHLRNLFRLDPADYLMSLTGKYILSELGSPGKSGSFFYFSRDYKYIIKTIHHAEHKFLRKILKDYYHHVTENPNTLLSQFYGLHRVKMPYGKKIHFVVMNNLFPPHRDIHTTFDLKGSTIGRDYREDDLDKNPRATLKDLNWMRRQRHLELGIQKKKLFLEQLQKDVVLMKKLKIMDYSLLIGIHDLQRGNEENLRGKTLQVFSPGGDNTQEDGEPPSVLLRTPSKLENARKARELRNMIRHERPVPMGQTATQMPDELDEGHTRSGYIFNQDDGGFQATHEDNSPADEIYYLGVIDCLTHYGMIKKIEHFWKGLTSDKTKISALPPEQYGDRFYNFVEGITMSPEEAIREKQRRDQEQIEAAAAAERQRVASWSSSMRRRSTANNIPPMPNYQPPPTPPGAPMSPEARETVERAQQDARRSERHGASETNVPDMVLSTAKMTERRESGGQGAPILPVVEEAAEASSLGGRSRGGGSRDGDDYRPATPAKTGMEARFAGLRDYAPPTPPKGHHLKPESQDSGYGALPNGNGSAMSREDSINLKPRLSRDSLDKALPPLPKEAGEQSKLRVGLA
ncbi:phosphatidylinositol-4-phosphate 5-kinase its3 [Colletotrichum tofieldiae]|uniref:1-phosphatidylinositol-4-phosphate 5-kinase n=1 Tax=Colletotrichum tofieldiae TaxID=708197 RepID=A0A166RZU1_9PEZI|nr:phosphatidylinositol-4-phosphate 5-kinase its3 [Colletotrichum tofieldiae]GKT64057.1 phosphatidylinositol-4-phosphate 5-kinase its3 [Colletotrichum tofieldiae]GKT71972.1 phosphatidylinositol-4-phosphate 5-kinase its3 [Colletotrichum tofieldiae]GKT90248.1 phosphatidylinositol-4-phosphate 5-kinase its3 [Colletotrichum tofieldiae]